MKCPCEQDLGGRVTRLCEHHTHFINESLGQLMKENDLLREQVGVYRGLIEAENVLSELMVFLKRTRKK